MKTVHDMYEATIEFEEGLLRDIIELLVFEKGVLDFSEPVERLDDFLNPPPGKCEAWNRHYKRELAKMRNKSA